MKVYLVWKLVWNEYNDRLVAVCKSESTAKEHARLITSGGEAAAIERWELEE